jgi:hypothetical protein
VQDTNLNVAVAVGAECMICSAAATITTVNLNNGSTDTFTGDPKGGPPQDAAIDSTTHRMAVIPFKDQEPGMVFDIYDISNKRLVTSAGSDTLSSPWFVAADPIHHLFLIADADWSPAGSSANNPLNVNNNSTSRILVYTEDGRLLKILNNWSNPATVYLPASFLQLNPATRTGYIIAPFYEDDEIEAFNY